MERGTWNTMAGEEYAKGTHRRGGVGWSGKGLIKKRGSNEHQCSTAVDRLISNRRERNFAGQKNLRDRVIPLRELDKIEKV